MFSQTGAPQKGGPHKRQKIFHAAIVVCIAARVLNKNVDDDYCACLVKAVGGGGIHILGAPHFFLNRGPVRSKSSTECDSSF